MMPFNSRHTVREYAGGSVGGILRKGGTQSQTSANTTSSTSSGTSGEARQIDLLVFGYACKVFRDDDKAREIDQGKHLINWMGDSSLKIDRYDVRGALYDLLPHEPPPGGYGNRLDYLSAEEQRAEQLCEEERYLFLYNNEEELILQQEEDLKRLKQESNSIGGSGGYNQVAFQYDESSGSGGGIQHGPNREENSQSPIGDEVEQAFCLPKNFNVPPSIQLPETMKQHAIIEKTARFIASQGVQMEILLKAKQSNNVQFEFLTQNSTLNAYYKYVVLAIKDGTYPVSEESAAAKKDNIDLAGMEDDNAAATAATTAATAATKPVITVPTIKYKPSPNCAYTQLISKIKGVPLPSIVDSQQESIKTDASTAAAAAATETASAGTSTTSINGAGNFTPVLLEYNGNTYVTAAEGATDSADPSKVGTNASSSGDVLSSKVEILKNSSALALAQGYSSDSEDSDAGDQAEVTSTSASTGTKATDTSTIVVLPPPPPKPEPILNFPIPTDNLKNIIDKTATYVIKNGRQFEETLRTKSEERFTFLQPENEHYPYYMYKITDDPDAASKEQKTRKAAAVAAALLSKKGLCAGGEKNMTPVSFSIKPKDEPSTASHPSVLPQENSDDDDENQYTVDSISGAGARSTVPENVQKAIQLVEIQLMARNAQLAAVAGVAVPPVHYRSGTSGGVGTAVPLIAATPVSSSSLHHHSSSSSYTNSTTPSMAPSTSGNGHVKLPHNRFDVDYKTSRSSITSSSSKSHTKSTKAEQERNALYEQQQQHRQKELKKAEEKVKDKLAQIAREKLGGLLTKEKQLQLERKRKAMAFLNQIKGTSPPSSTQLDGTNEKHNRTSDTGKNGNSDNANLNADDADDDEDANASDDSETSVHSIPITSYGPDDKTDDEAEQGLNFPTSTVPKLPASLQTQSSAVSATTRDVKKIKQKQDIPSPTTTATVTLSDDDDVQVISEIKAPTSLKHRQYRDHQQHNEHDKEKRSHRSNRKSSVTATHKRRSDTRDSMMVKHKRKRKSCYSVDLEKYCLVSPRSLQLSSASSSTSTSGSPSSSTSSGTSSSNDDDDGDGGDNGAVAKIATKLHRSKSRSSHKVSKDIHAKVKAKKSKHKSQSLSKSKKSKKHSHSRSRSRSHRSTTSTKIHATAAAATKRSHSRSSIDSVADQHGSRSRHDRDRDRDRDRNVEHCVRDRDYDREYHRDSHSSKYRSRHRSSHTPTPTKRKEKKRNKY